MLKLNRLIYSKLNNFNFTSRTLNLFIYSLLGVLFVGYTCISTKNNDVFWTGINAGEDQHYCNFQLNVFIGGSDFHPHTESELFAATRPNNYHSRKFFKNGALLYEISDRCATKVTTKTVTLGIDNYSLEYPWNRNCAYAAIGYGLTVDEEALYYEIVQAFQVALGSAV